MKKNISSGMLSFLMGILLSLFICSTALAEVKEFSKVRVDVPSGWDGVQQGATVIISKLDQSASVSITVDNIGKIKPEDLAKAFSAKLNGTAPVNEDGAFGFSFKNSEGVESFATLVTDPKGYCLIVMAGYSDEFEAILGSLEEK